MEYIGEYIVEHDSSGILKITNNETDIVNEGQEYLLLAVKEVPFEVEILEVESDRLDPQEILDELWNEEGLDDYVKDLLGESKSYTLHNVLDAAIAYQNSTKSREDSQE